jgi:hypothetical protein
MFYDLLLTLSIPYRIFHQKFNLSRIKSLIRIWIRLEGFGFLDPVPYADPHRDKKLDPVPYADPH